MDEHLVREIIRRKLNELADELGQFEQTTHGSIVTPLGNAFEKCYEKPSAFTISELAQQCRRFGTDRYERM